MKLEKMIEMKIRNADFEDLNDVVELENKIWPEGTRASFEKFKSRLKVFSRGFFLAYKNRELIGVSTSEIIKYDSKNPPVSWEKITDNGFIKNSHNINGNALYVVSIGAKSRSGGGSSLLSAQKELTKKLNLDLLVLGARIPGYGSYFEKTKIPIEKYVSLKREDNQLLDSELRFYTRNALEILKIVPNYMEDDKESRNYGCIMVWRNR